MKTALISRMRVKNISIPLFIITVFWVSVAAAEEVAIFNGKDLSGWETVDPQYWSVENGVIKGSSDTALPRNTFIWSKTPVEDFYLSVDVKLELDNRNAGIQFRSVKHGGHEALGYQADVGQDVWGRLYHESGRGKLDWRGLAEEHVKKGDWNHYEILAVGHRIWAAINGHLAFYTHDPQGELKGYIALQIHGGPAQTVRYRINKLVHDPDIKLAGKDEAALNQLIGYYNPLARIGKNSTEKITAAYANRQFTIKPHEMIVFTGGANLVREQEFAYLETLLASHYKKQKPKFRNMAWSGDTVYRQMREGGWGSMKDQLNWSGATAVLMQFGKMESLEGDAAMDNFIDHYGKLIEQLKQRTERITLISPFPFEAPRSKDAKDLSRHNKVLSNYVMAIAALAENKNLPFVDVFSPFLKHSEPLTNDGMHLSKKGWQVAAPFLAKELGAGSRTDLSQLTKAIQVKNRFWFDSWRPINWTFASSYLRNQAFRHPAGGFPELGNEFTRFKPFISKAEENIHLIALEKKPNLIEYPYRGVAEATQDPNETLKSFRVRDGFEVNVFASEKNGVINPVDMCWDAKGRLWVICSPMYPQIMPGEIAYDYILVCEDTNNDGKADKFHKYLEGLNMPMGLCLGHGGLYVTYNTQLLHYKDTNGDGKADDKEIILEGFGTGDAHHTINTPIWGPNGKLWISQGYNSYSYIESIDGVKSLSGGSTWRYDPRTLQLDNFFNNNGVGGNPRTVIFDQDDQPFLNDAPGDASHFLTPGLQPGATKLPYDRGLFKNGGKNSGLCFLDSSHFPEEHRGKAVGGGYYVNRIQLFNRVDNLAGYTTQPEQEIVFSPQRSFRVIDVNMGPDGALYATDWHNAVIGHYQASYRDPNRDHGHGRIWRVTYKDRPLVKKIDLSQLSIKELLAHVNSQESWTRYQSRRLLFHKTSAEILPVLKQWCQQDLDPMQTRSALGLYTAHVSTNLPLLKKALTSKDAATRAFATQTIGHWGTQLDHPLSLLKPMVHDANARVRLEAVVALGWSKEGAAIEVATEVLNYDFGLQLEIALKSCMRSLKQYWLPAFMKGELLFNNNKKQLGFFLAHAPDINIQTLKKIALSLPDEQKINILVSIAHAGDLDDIPFILEHGHKNTRVLKALVTEAQLSDNAGLFTQYAPSKIKLIECSSQNINVEDGRGLNAFDGNPQSSWHSQWSGARPPHPHHVTVELESSIELNGFSYLPRVDGRPGGVVDKFEVHTSLDNKNWALAKKGRFENILQNRGIHSIAFEQPVKAKYFKFTSISAINNDLYGGAAEIGLLSKNADEDIVKLLLASIEAGQKDALRLAGYWKLETLLPLLSEKATAISSDLNTVKASVEGLALLGDSKTILSVVKNNEKARSHSLAQLVSCDLNQALAYARNWAPTITSQNDFTLFFAAVSKQEGGIQKMVENFKSIAFSDQNKLAARHAVGRIGLESNELITLFGDNAKDSVGLIEYDKAWLDSFVKSVGKGNAQKGETLYDTKLAACASCHQIGNTGGKLGPPLTSIGTGMTTSLIVESVLWPDRQVKEGYESAVMSLHSGKTILGNIVHETKNEVTLKEVATETEHVVKTSQIKSFKKTGSIMPKGMVAHLTKEELRDLLKYLGELKGVGYK